MKNLASPESFFTDQLELVRRRQAELAFLSRDEHLPKPPQLCEAGYRPLPKETLDEELDFYRYYPWTLNAFLTVRETIDHLAQELSRLDQMGRDWCFAEIMANVFLLSSAISDVVDDYLIGTNYDFSKVESTLPFLGPCFRTFEKLAVLKRNLRHRGLIKLGRWRDEWEKAVLGFLRCYSAGEWQHSKELKESRRLLLSLLSEELPGDLQSSRIRNPAAFRTQDLTGSDILRLGKKFVCEFGVSEKPIIVVGLRTAGSYFAPLLQAYLLNAGYHDVGCVTLRPKKGVSTRESTRLREAAKKGSSAILIDEPAYSGSTVLTGVNVLWKHGIRRSDVVALFPVHPSRRDWRRGESFGVLEEVRIRTIEPEEYRKHLLLDPEQAEGRLREYFCARGCQEVRLVESDATRRLNDYLEGLDEKKFHARLKRVYEVHFQNKFGEEEKRYVLAKGVGWGWLSYQSFLAGERLAGHVPPLLGLREGILYTEWIPAATPEPQENRTLRVNSIAAYVAKRALALCLKEDPVPDLCRGNGHKGLEHLAEVLSRAYGWKSTAALKRPRILSELSQLSSPLPTLTDSKMRRIEWVEAGPVLLKTDFEQHGQGKIALNLADPAYDLAEAVLSFQLSEAEEKELLARYEKISMDTSVSERIFLYKLLAGTWAMASALANLVDARLASRQFEFNRHYLDAWNFCMIQSARFCAARCQPPQNCRWSSPLIMLDVDGVLDKMIFGYPSTTIAGMRAISLLHSHGFPVVLNTARSPMEVKEYCRAYGFVGGIGEYGSYLWDATTNRERILLSEESQEELARIRRALLQIPGVFLNEHYKNSVKAYTYSEERTIPLPRTLVQNLLDRLGVEGVTVHQTYTDSTIVAREVDKGAGMRSLLEMAGMSGAETLAIGDSESDLLMFRHATRSFAPANITCGSLARTLGCRIARLPYQMGLLEIVRTIVHSDRRRCHLCLNAEEVSSGGDDIFLKYLGAADQKRPTLLFRTLLDPRSLRMFVR